MAISVGTLEARNSLSQLVDRAERGEVITITRHGVPVAKLVPADKPDATDSQKAVDDWLKLRSGNRLGKGLTARDLITEGRR